jgi:hypothetical protein
VLRKIAIALLILANLHVASAVASVDANDCQKLYRLTDLSYAIEPGRWIAKDDNLPAYCRVRGVINRAIRFEVTLPKDWNGRFMFSTVGGSAGEIGDITSLLSNGYAMASTDTGHEGQGNFDFYNQPEALLDYAFRGVHLAGIAAKKVVEHYYKDDIDYSYLSGCSNGGRAAMLEATRFPNDYDGIIAGAPLFRFEEMAPWMLSVGRAQAQHPLTKDSLLLLDNASREACDGLDGVVDGVINDPRLCTADLYDVARLTCASGQTSGCLTEGQVQTALTVYGGLKNSQGEIVAPGVLPGAEAAGDWAFWQLPNELMDADSLVLGASEMLALVMRHDPSFDLDKFDPGNDQAVIKEAVAPLDVLTADLSEFKAQGGKLLMYQGWNDYPLRPQRAIDYLAAVEKEMGGVEKTAKFYRMFMVPGMTHCAGGPGAWQADYVTALTNWREKGKAPKRILATQPGPMNMAHLAADPAVAPKNKFTRPLCVFPKLAAYKGKGDNSDAANYSCTVP